ncbi:hypothetical protein [Persicitalea jodogahamensis]|uniref:DUF4332 domain-containing protein n=1 Tax=Persicitalea jodogahamensis TaxID=402147 RepID=A0A8J3G9S5_9BACT|nr:hypothetical protein [Persicitalea jodogahamensis]GHB77581.1 hypothetical protein GCM10007390_34690 [Persicitalea jodogahamensis]
MFLLQLEPLTRPVAISEILILLASAAFIGWLLARLLLSGQISGLRASIAERRTEVNDCQATLAVTTPVGAAAPVVSSYAAPVAPKVTLPTESVSTVATVPPIQSAADNLKLIEGIGPKIEELLNADGIRTFAKLAATDSGHLASLLQAAGARFQIHNPKTWPQQASLARDGKWDELKALQEQLTGGRG